MSERCDRCSHWVTDDETWESKGVGFKKCAAVRERWVIQDEANSDLFPNANNTDDWIQRRKDALKESRAYVEDGSEYKAVLLTAPDFYCALFHPISD